MQRYGTVRLNGWIKWCAYHMYDLSLQSRFKPPVMNVPAGYIARCYIFPYDFYGAATSSVTSWYDS